MTDDVKFEKTSFPSSVPAETPFRTTLSSESEHEGVHIQHVKIDAGDGTDAQISPLFDQYFMKGGIPTTLSALSVLDAYTVIVTSATSFSVGSILFLASGERFYVGGVLSVVSNTLTLDTPLDYAYPSGAVAISMVNNMAVDGNSTRQIFSVQSGANLTIDIHRIIFTIVDGAAMDDGLFGSLAALSKGIVLRLVNGTYRNIANAKKNGDFRVFAYDVDYHAKAPAGKYGMGVRFTFGGDDKHGAVIRLRHGDELQLIVQDDLTELDEVLMTAQGHLVE